MERYIFLHFDKVEDGILYSQDACVKVKCFSTIPKMMRTLSFSEREREEGIKHWRPWRAYLRRRIAAWLGLIPKRALSASALSPSSQEDIKSSRKLNNNFLFINMVLLLSNFLGSLHRQVIIVTHNPNIAVLGDAELIIPLKSTSVHSQIISSGSIDNNDTVKLCCSILEGGDSAFKQRKNIYGF